MIVDHTTDNVLMKFRFTHAKVQMQAAEEEFEAGGRKFRAGAFVIPNADRAALEPTMKELGIIGIRGRVRRRRWRCTTSTCRASATCTRGRTRRTKAGSVPRSTPTACPTPTSATSSCARATCAQKYDVIVYPHVGGSAQAQVNGIPKTGTMPLPYKKTAETPNLGVQDQADDIRGGMGWEGLMELVKFVREGGTLITEGATATIFPEYNVTTGVTVEDAGRPVRARLDHARRRSPIGAARSRTATTRSCRSTSARRRCSTRAAAPAGSAAAAAAAARLPGVGMNTQPMATAPQQRLSTWDPD